MGSKKKHFTLIFITKSVFQIWKLRVIYQENIFEGFWLNENKSKIKMTKTSTKILKTLRWGTQFQVQDTWKTPDKTPTTIQDKLLIRKSSIVLLRWRVTLLRYIKIPSFYQIAMTWTTSQMICYHVDCFYLFLVVSLLQLVLWWKYHVSSYVHSAAIFVTCPEI